MVSKDNLQKNIDSREQLERYRLLVENIKDYAIFLLDTNGNIASWNLGAERFKGYKPHEIIGKHFSIFYSQQDKVNKKPENELKISLLNGRVEDEGWRYRKDGTKFWANVVITALFDSEGNHKGFAKVTRDLTERKEYEDTLYSTNVALESSYKRVKEQNVAKDEFVSLASHQLRTPATGVKQYLSLVLGGYTGELTKIQRDYIQKAYDSNNRQIEIINDLLQVAQLDAGKLILHKKLTDIKKLVKNVIEEQDDKFKHRSQSVSVKLPSKPAKAIVDSDRLRMVIDNLIDNASKYTPEKGSIKISLTTAKNLVSISVEDTGVGIKKSDMPLLFEKFTRIPNPSTQRISGSGLGLYWANKIIDLHDGKIGVSSKPGKGSVFSINIPAEVKNV